MKWKRCEMCEMVMENLVSFFVVVIDFPHDDDDDDIDTNMVSYFPVRMHVSDSSRLYRQSRHISPKMRTLLIVQAMSFPNRTTFSFPGLLSERGSVCSVYDTKYSEIVD